MFQFKKAMQGMSKAESFECECCGPKDGVSSNETTGCGCGPINSMCCGPMEKSSCCDGASNCDTNEAEKTQPVAQSDCNCSECK